MRNPRSSSLRPEGTSPAMIPATLPAARQASNTRALSFDVPTLIEVISSIMTLERGDVIATGTPRGVGPLRPGDVVEVEIGGVGVLRNRVVPGQ